MTTSQRSQQTERLLETACSLSKVQEHAQFLQGLISAATELTNSESAYVLEYDSSSKQFYFAAVPWFHREALQTLKVLSSGSAAGWVHEHGQPLILQDAQSDARHDKNFDLAAGFTTISLLAVSIQYRGQRLGVLETVNKTGNAHYTEEDAAILEMLACLAAASIANAAMERRVQAAYEEMSELERMKKDFIAITSHELRTPLGLILGHSTFLRELVEEKYREQLDTIIRNATRLKEIIESLSSVDNIQSGAARLRRRTVPIMRVAVEVVASFKEEARQKDITLGLDVGEDELVIEGDVNKITTALTNLVKNAISFTNTGGHVFVLAERIPGFVKVSVVDDGIGIPSKDLPHVFERFYQVESHLTRRHGGMGLGLSVAKSMVELHGGRLWAESAEGKGSIFTFVLPLETPPENAKGGAFLS